MKKYCLLLFLFGYIFSAKSQSESFSSGDQNIRTSAKSYMQKAAVHSIIYSGREHPKYPLFVIGHPFLNKEEYTTGELHYDGILYPDIKLRLDKYKDELIVQSPNGLHNIIIPNDKVQYAEIYSYHIFYHTPDNLKGSPPAGYYMQLYKGRYTVLEKQNSTYQEVIKDMKVEASFTHSTRFYILKDDIYYMVRGKGAVLKVLKDKKRDLKQFIRQESLDFRADPEKAVVEVVKYYETLSQ